MQILESASRCLPLPRLARADSGSQSPLARGVPGLPRRRPLRPRGAPEGQQNAHFFYEADRKTTSTKKFIKKLRAHFRYIARGRKHEEKYQIRRVRAVLIETLDTAWAEELRQAARHPIVSGNKPTPLFWFTASEVFTESREVEQGRGMRKISRFLAEPDLIFKKVWATPLTQDSQELVSLLD